MISTIFGGRVCFVASGFGVETVAASFSAGVSSACGAVATSKELINRSEIAAHRQRRGNLDAGVDDAGGLPLQRSVGAGYCHYGHIAAGRGRTG